MKFFVACPLGAESEVAEEIRESWPFLLDKDAKPHALSVPEIELTKGGVGFECDLFLGLQLNFFLKCANRILLRLSEFRCRDFPKLHSKLKNLPWTQYLSSENVEWEISAAQSRLNNEKRIQAIGAEIFAGLKWSERSTNQVAQKIFIRAMDDEFFVSLDTSGEHLHKRGWGVLKGEAPLRETLASFLLRKMCVDSSLPELSRVELVDPMCGSGTFLTEAASLFQPHFKRQFAFQNWKNCPTFFKLDKFPLNYKIPDFSLFAQLTGLDHNPRMIEISQKNSEQFPNRNQMSFQVEDFYQAQVRPPVANRQRWLICNPPYGDRLVHGHTTKDFIQQLVRIWTPQKFAILLPENQWQGIVPPVSYRLVLSQPVNHGGIKTLFKVYQQI